MRDSGRETFRDGGGSRWKAYNGDREEFFSVLIGKLDKYIFYIEMYRRGLLLRTELF